jgi:putative glutamine amidotransferase
VVSCRRILDPHPFHVVGEKYFQALVDGARAIPVGIPALGSELEADHLAKRLDGLLLTGSQSNIEPHHYGEPGTDVGPLIDPHRDATVFHLIEAALQHGTPLLAICRGSQELNVAMGGTLHRNLEQAGFHGHQEDPDEPVAVQYGPSHQVRFEPDGLLFQLAGAATATVNSLHGQGVRTLGETLTPLAYATDGLVEAFHIEEVPGFNLAVQWHPEWQTKQDRLSMSIFQAFGDACREFGE